MDPKTRFRLEALIVTVIVVFLLVGIYFIFPNLVNVEPPDRTDWAYEVTQVDELHEDGFFGDGVVVGIIDTGIDLEHEAMSNIELVAWKDLVNHKPDPYDDDGHGTTIAALIASEKFGVAPNCNLIVVKAIEGSGSGSESDIVDAIDYCKIKGADVISLSLGRQQLRREDITRPWGIGETDLEIACESAINAGIFLVGAADNDGEYDDNEVGVPSIYEDVIAVGAIDENLKIAPFSSAGSNDGKLPGWDDPYDTSDPDKKPELVAPGVEITSPSTNDKYVISEGTSIAVPFVTGIIAIILGELPRYQHENNTGVDTVDKFKTAFMNTAEKLPGQSIPHDDHYGYGLIQGYDAYVALK
jgi:serine protease AprX